MGNLQFPIRNPCSNAHSGRQVAGIVPTWNSSRTNTQAAWQTEPWKQLGWLPQFCRTHYITGWWYTYTSEKWLSSSVGSMTFPIYGKNDVPNHLPERNTIFYNWVYPTNSISIPYNMLQPHCYSTKKTWRFSFFLSASNKRMDLRHASWHVPREADSDPVTLAEIGYTESYLPSGNLI